MNVNSTAVSELQALGYKMPEIRRAILALNCVTHTELSRETGIHVESVKKYIGGRRRKTENQKLIADYFHVPVDAFFSDVNC